MAASAPADPAGGPPPPTDRARAHRTLVCVAGIGVTQIVGWGSTFFVPAVLGRHIQEELGLPSEVVFAGVTIMFAISGVAAPRVGRHVDRHGGRRVMAAGSVLAALALVGLSMSQGLVGYIAAWIAIGMATAMMLSTPAFTTLAQVAGPGARRALAMLTTVAGMSSTVFWPLTGALDAALGWRSTVLVFAATHILLCLPIHLFIVPAGAAGRAPEPAGGAKPAPEPPPAANHRLTFPLLAIALSLGTLVYNGLSLHMIEVFRQLGHGPAVAVAIASMIGPAQVGIRIVEIALGNRYAAMSSGLVAAATLPLALAIGLAAGDALYAAAACALIYGISNGLKAVVRAALPLALFGPASYGAYLGRLAVSQNLVSAVAPVVFAALIARLGVGTALGIAIAAALASLAALLALWRVTRPAA